MRRSAANAYVQFVVLDRSCERLCNFNDPHCDRPGSTGQELSNGAAVSLEGFQEILRLGKSLQIVIAGLRRKWGQLRLRILQTRATKH